MFDGERWQSRLGSREVATGFGNERCRTAESSSTLPVCMSSIKRPIDGGSRKKPYVSRDTQTTVIKRRNLVSGTLIGQFDGLCHVFSPRFFDKLVTAECPIFRFCVSLIRSQGIMGY